MNRQIAEDLMAGLSTLNESMNSVAARIELVDTEDQKLTLRRVIADMIGTVYTDLMRPIIREYPDLDPDR